MMTDAAPVPNARAVLARFELDPTHGPVCIQTIGHEAGAATVIEKVADHHVLAHPTAFAKFQASRASVAPIGLPLKRGLAMDDDLVRLFNAHGVMDVETFATLSDGKFFQVMPGNPHAGIEIRDRARLMVPEDRRTPLPAASPVRPGPASREAAMEEIETLKARLAASEREKADALQQVAALSIPMVVADEPEDIAGEGASASAFEDPVRRGPGRPRKA